MENKEKKEAAVQRTVSKHSKDKILESERYADRRDILGAVLKDGVQYSIDEVDKMLENFMKGKVK